MKAVFLSGWLPASHRPTPERRFAQPRLGRNICKSGGARHQPRS